MTGTLQDPMTLATALSNPGGIIMSTHTIWFRNGVYAGGFSESNKLSGVNLKPYQAERPQIDSLYTSGQSLIFRGLEFCDTDFLDRENNIPERDGIRFETTASGTKLVNSIIHDCRQGSLKDVGCPSIEYYGNLIYYNGWQGAIRGSGHGIYAGNGNDTALIVKDNIIHSQFGWGLHLYAEGSDWNDEKLKNLQVDGCTFFDNGILASEVNGNVIGGSGAGTTVRTSWLKNCYIKDKLQIGGVSTGCTDFVLQGNVIVGNVTILYYAAATQPITITGNKFFGTVSIKNGDTGLFDDPATVYPDNEYLSAIPDCHMLRANTYDATRANLTIFNGSEAATIEVDVSAIYANGTQVQARNVQDYFADIQTLTVTAGKIVVNMQAINRTVAAPQGWTAPATTFPAFGCFILQA